MKPMKLTASQSEALRTFAMRLPQFRMCWRDERYLLRTFKIHRVTLEALARLGIVERAIHLDCDARDFSVCRLTPLAAGMIAALLRET